MNALQSFTFEDHGVRTLLRDEAPWFVLADVCRVLEIGNSRQAATRLDDDEKDVITSDTLGGPQNTNIVNESGLYSLILTSRKPAAKRFKKWVTAEVLPALRRTGMYVMDGDDEDMPLSADGKVFGMRVAKVNAAARLIGVANTIYGPEAARALWEAEAGLPPVRHHVLRLSGGVAQDPIGCMRHLLRSVAEKRQTVADLLALAFHDGIAERSLRNYGLALGPTVGVDLVAVANRHAFLEAAFAGTPWEADWRVDLVKLPGARLSRVGFCYAGENSRAVLIPKATLLSLMQPMN